MAPSLPPKGGGYKTARALDGRRPDIGGGVSWLPQDNRLLRRGREGMDIITIAGEVLTHIDDTYNNEWAFSHDGRRLAYVRGELPEGPFAVAVFDLESSESWDVRAASAASIRWRAADSRLILGVYELQNGELIEVVDYPPR